MEIHRIINDKKYTFKLSASELCAAYYEQEHIYDEADVRDWLDKMTDEQLEDCGVDREEANALVPMIADRMRYYLEDSPLEGELWYDARENATDDVLAQYVKDRE